MESSLSEDPMNASTNQSMFQSPPGFDDMSLVKVSVLCSFFVVSVLGNCLTLWRMFQMRRRRASLNTLLTHLCIADLLVSFFCILGDAIWNSTVQWLAGEVLCKAFKFLQVFSLNLSTYIIVLISVDRCLAVVNPLLRERRTTIIKILLAIAWLISSILSIPQIFIFRVYRGPFEEDFYQCMTDPVYTLSWHADAYLISSTALLFFVPLAIIIICYARIICAITIKSSSSRDANKDQEYKIVSASNTGVRIGFNAQRAELFSRAKYKSLKLTATIVASFLICWSPYFVSMFGSKYFRWDELSPKAQASIFFFGMSNSLINPLIYGLFHLSRKKSPDYRNTSLVDSRILSRNQSVHRHNEYVSNASAIMMKELRNTNHTSSS